MAARCCSTKSAKWTSACRPSCCAPFRNARSTASAAAKPVKVDIRIIATSNRDLAEAAKRGTFREDLLYRLNVVNLRLPALRERPKDILALWPSTSPTNMPQANGVPVPAHRARDRAPAPVACLARQRARTRKHHAPRRAAGERPRDLPEAIRLPDGTHVGTCESVPDLSGPVKAAVETAQAATRSLVGRTVADVERDLILDTLDHCLGNRTHAANILGISIRTLRNKLREYRQMPAWPVPSHGEHAAGRLMRTT